VEASASPSAPAPGRRTLYRGAALADGKSPRLRPAVSILVDDGRIAWIRPSDSEENPGNTRDLDVVDAGGATIVPGMVDAHSHLTGPGGANWIERFSDPPARLLEVAEQNGRLMMGAGIRWARDVGAPTRRDPSDGRERALSLGIRDRWRGHAEYPYVRAAGTWVTRAGILPAGLSVEAQDSREMRARALRQLDDGADLVKLYVNQADPEWSVAELRETVDAVHARDRRVTAHAVRLAGVRACAEAGVDSIEHGFEIDAAVARLMAVRRVKLVTTLTVYQTRIGFSRTTTGGPFSGAEARRRAQRSLEVATASARTAHRAGVFICAGTDFGGGGPRANQLAWEVESLVAASLEPWEALGAATWHGGELLGERDAGTIREGGPADFFLVDGDPLSDPRALWRVWQTAW
jgi:imidazolonepropionase-like amidohydrolase